MPGNVHQQTFVLHQVKQFFTERRAPLYSSSGVPVVLKLHLVKDNLTGWRIIRECSNCYRASGEQDNSKGMVPSCKVPELHSTPVCRVDAREEG
ncbi:hypothetical protein E2C01_050258 [Portunus trituberculatus]|uniref:Uncharacterized protein n=1 Tax=Portunus trituberculatus TaxID=210409 RepID=A0A5B7GFZ2_PORTR|nr:hypothetical protein [Portunus trituberculatus]